MKRPRLFVEPFCGSAAVSLALVGGRNLKPPIAYMGSKRGYSSTILAAMGLRSGLGTDALILNDAGPWGLVWACLMAPGGADAVATTIRGWADEDPAALFARLKAEAPKDFIGTGEIEDVARWMMLGVWSYRQGDPTTCGNGTLPQDTGGITRRSTAVAVAVAVVARWLVLAGLAYRLGFPESGYATMSKSRTIDQRDVSRDVTKISGIHCRSVAVHHADAASIPIPADASGAVVYLDPPYVGTTAYQADCPRADVLALARRWSDAGAVVAVSEACPLADDLGSGWDAIKLNSERRGQSRTFSKQQAEWLTLNRPPMYRPAIQQAMFAV